ESHVFLTDDFNEIIDRALKVGVEKFMITGGSLDDSREALKLAETRGNNDSTFSATK
uniref:Uncharacterized protein n=1 Tax=Haplochromis burtoni TaxID=8153 RepID=A0A3Q2W0S9_HAPBU